MYYLDAIDENGDITELGKEICKFPLEPAYAKALVSGIMMGCAEQLCIVRDFNQFKINF